MKKLDSTTLTSIAAEKAGMSYGNYVAKFGVVQPQEAVETSDDGTKICPVCGKSFVGRRWNAVYCSAECQIKRGSKDYMKKYREQRREKLKAMDRVCVVCGKPIPEGRNLKAKTCCEDCSAELEKQTKRQKDAQYREKKKTVKTYERTCPICGEEFIPAVHNQKYCSNECYSYANNQRSKKNNMMKKEERNGK